MTKQLIYLLFILLTSCRGASLQSITLASDDNRILCNGIKNMIDFIKESEDVKKRYKIDEIQLKTLKVYGQVSKTTEYKILNLECDLLVDKKPDFQLLYMYTIESKELSGQLATIVKRNSFSTGFNFTATLNNNGKLEQVEIRPFSE